MDMGTAGQLIWGSSLLILCSLIHIVALIWTIRILPAISDNLVAAHDIVKRLSLMLVAFALVLLSHTVHVWIWALAFFWPGVLEALGDSIYFSLVTYTTLGYGDVVLGKDHRIFAAMAAVTGLLNFGLSTAFLASLFARMIPEVKT